jgi:hypothetical protein
VSITFRLWIMCLSRSGTSSPSGSLIISWFDLSSSKTMTHDSSRINMYPHLIFDIGWTRGGRQAGLTTWLDLPSDYRKACEKSNEDIWCLTVKCRESTSRRYTVRFGRHILRDICLVERTEEKDSSDKASRSASFSSSRPSSLGDYEASSEFRPIMGSLQNRISSHSSTGTICISRVQGRWTGI